MNIYDGTLLMTSNKSESLSESSSIKTDTHPL